MVTPHLLHLSPVVEHIACKVKFLGPIEVVPFGDSNSCDRAAVQMPRGSLETAEGFSDSPESPQSHQPLHGGTAVRNQTQKSQVTSCMGKRQFIGWLCRWNNWEGTTS